MGKDFIFWEDKLKYPKAAKRKNKKSLKLKKMKIQRKRKDQKSRKINPQRVKLPL